MDKSILDYYSHRTNVLNLGNGFVLGREKVKSIEYITIEFDDEIIYGFWHNPKKKLSKKPPKHTGGKLSYVKLMIEGIKKHNLSIDEAGLLVKLADNIEWNTNLLINKRNKKPLIINDISVIVGIGRNKTLTIVKGLTQANLLTKNKDGYKISPTLMQKGGVKK